MDIKSAKGIIVPKDGIPRSFGKTIFDSVNKLTDDNYHDTAFQEDIMQQTWYQLLGINYDDSKSMHNQLPELADQGLMLILNCSSLTSKGEKNYTYEIVCSNNLSLEQRKTLEENYDSLSRQIEEDKAWFYGEIVNDITDINKNIPAYNLDDFYDSLNLAKEKSIHKKRSGV